MPTASAPDRLIVALSQLHATGQDEPTKALVGSVAGVLHTSSTMRNACANLKKNGITDCSNPKTLKLTQKGHDKARALAGAVQLPTSGTDFHARNKTMLQKMKGSGNKATEIYALLQNGQSLTDDEISKGINVDKKKSTYRNAKAPLNKLGFLEAVDGGRFQLADKCFPLGRKYRMGVETI